MSELAERMGIGPTTERLMRAAAHRHGKPRVDLEEGRAFVYLSPVPPSVNAVSSHRFAKRDRKGRLESELTLLLLAAGVPQPIPGDLVLASAVLAFPVTRRRDEDNYRAEFSKALGDTLDPHSREAPYRWLSDDTPAHFRFGSVSFERDPGAPRAGAATLLLQWNPRRPLLVFAPSIDQARIGLEDDGINPRDRRVRIVRGEPGELHGYAMRGTLGEPELTDPEVRIYHEPRLPDPVFIALAEARSRGLTPRRRR